MKKVYLTTLAVLLTFCMMCGLSINTFASEDTTIDYDTALEQRGYPQIVLETLDISLKEELYYENVDFAGAIINYYDEENGIFSDITIKEDGTYMNQKEQISSSDLSLANIYAKYKDSSGQLNYIKVIYNYKWINLPLFRWQDSIAVSWDNNLFEMSANSFKKYDKYNGYDADGNFYQGQIHSSGTDFANASNSGVSWYADLKGYIGLRASNLYGYATFNLVPKYNTYSGSLTLYSHYIHQTVQGNIGITVFKNPYKASIFLYKLKI